MTSVDSEHTHPSDTAATFSPETGLAEFDPRGGEICVDVVVAVAEAFGRDPETLDPITNAVDVEALDALINRGPSSSTDVTSVTFTYLGVEVTVSSDGLISLSTPVA